MRLLARYLADYWRLIALALFLAAINQIFSLLDPLIFRHVIDQYKHREQTITCVCGWHGSSATNATGGSDWTTHLNQFRTKRK